MKNFSIALNIVLVVAVAVLFYLVLSNKQPKAPVYGPQVADSASPASFKIAYFESDSLEKQYEYYKEARTKIRAKEEENGRVMTGMRSRYTSRLKELQQRANTMSQNEQQAAQQELAQMEQEFEATGQRLQQDMQAESMRHLQEVKNKIQAFLKDYAREKGYIFVFGSNEYDYLYYKDSTRDITSDVVKLLNERYKAEKPAKK